MEDIGERQMSRTINSLAAAVAAVLLTVATIVPVVTAPPAFAALVLA